MSSLYRIVALLSCALALHAQSTSKQTEMDRIFSAFNNHTPGCAVGVAQKGSVVLKSGYGMADLERNVPITPDTIFESGSLAKQFTAAALMLLAQQGKISLDDPMRKYLPELQDVPPFTIRQVISHVSGIREWRPLATFGGRPEGTYVLDNHDLLHMASHQRALNFEPGTHYSYTNTGFNISTILIERALGNGKTFQSFTHDNIFTPLGMDHSRWRDDFRTIVPNRALAYTRNSDRWIQDTPIENIIGAGGLLTTVGDLLLWNENFTHAKVGGPAMVQAQQTPVTLKPADGNPARTITYAAGLVVSTVNGLHEVSHSGSTGGYRTWLGRYPEQGVSVAVMCNSAQANPPALGREAARLWTGAAAPKPLASSYTVDAANAAALDGMYRKLRDNTAVEVHWREGKLMFDRTELFAVSPNKFVAAGERQVNFEDGPLARMRVITPDADIVYEKVSAAVPTAAEIAALSGAYESRETGTTLLLAAGGKPGEVVALSIGEDRVWDLRFMRVK